MANVTETSRKVGDRRGIQSVEIGLRLIEALSAAKQSLSLKELASAAGLPISNCHRYCVSFVRTAYLVQDGRSGRYDLGPRLIASGLGALARTDAVSAATAALEALVEETGHTGQLAIWGDAGPVIIRWLTGRRAVRTSAAAGSTLPLLTSATGRVFLAFLPERQTAPFSARETVASGLDPRAIVAQVRASGVGRVSGDHIPGLNAVAAPVLDTFGEAAAVITLVAANEDIDADAVDRLRAWAARASAKLGAHASTIAPPACA